MDLVIGNATVITMNARREVLRDAEVIIQGDRIVKVGAPPAVGARRGSGACSTRAARWCCRG